MIFSKMELLILVQYSKIFGYNGLPDVGETSVSFRDLELSLLASGYLHFTHVSVSKSVELILLYKEKIKYNF